MGNVKIRAIVTTGYGTNCEVEMAHAVRLGGADVVDIVHLSDLLDGSVRLCDYQFLNLPGGFLDGDNLGAAQAGAHRLKYATIKGLGRRLIDEILEFVERGGLVLGICNGFQLLVKTGLLPGFDSDYTKRLVSLTYNDSGRFEDRWVTLKANPDSPCIFTKGIHTLEVPVRHGEGKFVTKDEGVLERLKKEGLIVFQYADQDTLEATMTYPQNPNGSIEAIAGITDPTGRIFGLMPHPEAFTHRTNHPRWTRLDLPEEGAGVAIFKNACDYLKEA